MSARDVRRALVERWGAAGAPWRVLALGAVLALALTVLGAEVLDNVLEGEGVAGLDQPALRFAVEHRTPGWTSFFEGVTTLGETVVITVVSVLVVALALLRRRWVAAGQVAVAATGAGVLVVVGKALVGRQRPPEVTRLTVEQTLSFPSGHALGSAVLAATLVSLVLASRAARAWRVLAVVVAAVVVALVGLSRVYLGVHWVTDVLGGWLVGGTWATVCATAASLLRLRGTAPAPPALS